MTLDVMYLLMGAGPARHRQKRAHPGLPRLTMPNEVLPLHHRSAGNAILAQQFKHCTHRIRRRQTFEITTHYLNGFQVIRQLPRCG